MVIVKGIMMITWLLLVSLFFKSTQENGECGALHCGPQNLMLNSSGQMILLTWEDMPSCSAVEDVLIYELVVLIADKQVHYDEVAVRPDQIESTHSWNWTSYLALDCASHSVRLSSRYKNHTSPWKQERTLPGLETPEMPEVFPKDREFKVGSTVTFCCVLPTKEVFNKMHLTGYSSDNMNAIKIGNQIYALTVTLNQASKDSCTDVKCETNTNENGACAYIGYPPDLSEFQCETQDLESVICLWTVGRDTDLPIKSPTVYQLLGSPCAKGPKGRCSQKVQVDVGCRNWTLTAHNKFGEMELSDTADLTKRVHMFPPKQVTASTLNARNVSLEWGWTVPQYNNLNITCQINISNGENTIVENIGVGITFSVLNDLIPNWTYNVTVRCGTTQHFWKWSDWSTSVNFQTKGDVPDALDVWMQMKEKLIIIIWKIPFANQSHGHIRDYEVAWTKTAEREQQNRAKVTPNNNSLALSLDTSEEYMVTVTARNINGSSFPSTITIPSLNPDINRVNTSWFIGSVGGFNLSWSASPKASCGYIVDWCPTLGQCIVEWKKVHPNETQTSIFSKNFKEGLRYSLSVYTCTQGPPVLQERREGYVSEKRIQDGLFKSLKGKQHNSDFEVSWDPISLREQTAFIHGYVLYCLDNNNVIINFSTDDPEATSLTARNLKISSYTFTVKALTSVGECGAALITVTLNSLTDYLIKAVFISLAIVFGLLSLITTLCYRHWTSIKQRVYPPIPKPVLMSPGGHRCLPLHMEQCHHSEADFVDVLELHCSAGGPMNEYASPENMPFVFAQTPKVYQIQRLKKCTPQRLTLLTTAIPSQSRLQSSSFRSVLSNSSYNLIIQPGDTESNSGPELQEGSSLERCCGGFQPQIHTEIFTENQREEDAESPMSCVSTYIWFDSQRPDSCCMQSL
ncbi:leukemia inhibitory factor receptor-like [Anoplopoma fimbria]|uniref:leukemia inhibitory factor receptor-like n=1 Tax=Anoplopoma fimbria TaxID=229290 RepID=UPI0023EC8219|nr:leukemia inhibitory factor receptor-like [Anoplopoma fimbria]